MEWADYPLAVWQGCQECPWGTAIPLKTGWESLGIFSSGLSCVTIVVPCLGEKIILYFFLYRELLMGQPQP